MGIRKFRADYLFNGSEILSSDAVLLTDENGVITGITDVANAGDKIEIYQGLITPGFINTHCHLELSHMKQVIPPGTGLMEFLTRVIKQRNFAPEVINTAMKQADEEMFAAGIIAVGDVCNTTDSIHIKKESQINWFNFIEVIGFNPNDARARMEYAGKILQEFRNAHSSKDQISLNASLSPHAPYSVSNDLFQLINESSAGSIITVHNQESEAENTLYVNKSGPLLEFYKNLNIDAGPFHASGKTSLQTYLPKLNHAANIILVHNVFTDVTDLQFTRENNLSAHLYFCICINANQYIQAANPPIDMLREHQCLITLGTDSYAGNFQLSILEEMKTVHSEFPSIPLAEILQWATINGAKALKMENTLGSFEPGKQPGVVLISGISGQHLSRHSTAKRLL